MKDHGIREFHIEDDNFTFYKEHVVNVCSAIRKAGINVPLGIPNGVRVDRLDDEICAEMKSAGFYFFSIGLESGSPATLKQMKKALNLDRAKRGIELITKYGFRVKGFFILGYPNETREGILETIKWSKSTGPGLLFHLYPSTRHSGVSITRRKRHAGYQDLPVGRLLHR